MKSVALAFATAGLAFSAGGGSRAQEVGAEPVQAVQPQAREKTDPRLVVEEVNRALRGARDLPAGVVTALVHADTIVLTGEVPSEAQAARALAVAEQSAQDVRVASHLTVASGGAGTPQVPALVRSVETALRADPRTTNLGILVSIEGQDVIGLHGLVPSRESGAAAEQVAARVQGVGRVSSQLVIAGE